MPTRPIFGEGRSRVGKKPSTAPTLIYRGNEDSMSGRWLEYRGRPVPDGPPGAFEQKVETPAKMDAKTTAIKVTH